MNQRNDTQHGSPESVAISTAIAEQTLWIEDGNRTIIHVDPAFAKSLGRAPEDILGQRADEFRGSARSDARDIPKSLRARLYLSRWRARFIHRLHLAPLKTCAGPKPS